VIVVMAASKVWPLPIFFLLIGVFQCVNADIVWPEYNQFCSDDAGPPYLDDEETFPNGGKYHDTSEAIPILQDGQCAPKMMKACSERPNIRTAYFEGPIDCDGNGWYCRIMPDENWKPYNLKGDVNFGHCNTTNGIGDAGFDQDGHCHGSSDDNTYYWWMRDHYHRQYNGRLRCCCGWYNTPDDPQNLYFGRIANRCDYRKMLNRGEAATCRDANEEHNSGYDDIGCKASISEPQIGNPIPEDDSKCWEMAQFGLPEDGDNDDFNPLESPEPTSMSENDGDDEGNNDSEDGGDGEDGEDEEEEDEEEDEDGDEGDNDNEEDEEEEDEEEEDEEDDCEDQKGKFLLKLKKKKGQVVGKKVKKCKWLSKMKNENKRNKICKRTKRHKKFRPAQEVCLKTCKKCDENNSDDEDEDGSGDSDGDEEGEDGEGDGDEEGDESEDEDENGRW